MSEAHYYLRAVFPPEEIRGENIKVYLFFKEMFAADKFWNKNRNRADKEEFWIELSTDFPNIAKYINTLNLPKPNNSNTLSAYLIWGEEDGLEDEIEINSTILKWSSEQSDFLNLDGVADFLKSEYGAIDVRWTSEMLIDCFKILEMESGNEVVDAILNKPKENLPTFLNNHPLLNAKIAEKLTED